MGLTLRAGHALLKDLLPATRARIRIAEQREKRTIEGSLTRKLIRFWMLPVVAIPFILLELRILDALGGVLSNIPLIFTSSVFIVSYVMVVLIHFCSIIFSISRFRSTVENNSRPLNVDKFPQYWEFFRYILPKRVQNSAWEPAFWELMEDFYSVIDRIEGRKCLTRWIVFCFTVRTVLMYVQCLRAFAADATIGWLIRTFKSMIGPRG